MNRKGQLFRISIHSRPLDDITSFPICLAGKDYEALQVDPDQRVAAMAVSFEEAVAALEKLPRLFIEPDGAFVWAGRHDEVDWQIDGCLYDRAHRLLYVDLAGSCPQGPLDDILSALGWPDSPLMFQLSQQGVFLGEQEFRKWLISS